MYNFALSDCDLLADEVHIKLNVFCAFVVHWIGAHVAGGDIVAEDDGGLREGTVQFA